MNKRLCFILSKLNDVILHIDTKDALQPLHMPEIKEDNDLPETSPTGLW